MSTTRTTRSPRAVARGLDDGDLAEVVRELLAWQSMGMLAQDGTFARLRHEMEVAGEWIDERAFEQAVLCEASLRFTHVVAVLREVASRFPSVDASSGTPVADAAANQERHDNGPMSLAAFVQECHEDASRFAAHWRAQAAKSPQEWPLAMAPGDWFEQFVSFQTSGSPHD